VTGYNLVSSSSGRGHVGVITEATCAFFEAPAKKTCSPSSTTGRRGDGGGGIMAGGVIPATLEIMDQKSINCVEDY